MSEVAPAALAIALLWTNADGLQCVLSAEAGCFVARVTKGDTLVMVDRFDDERKALATASEWRGKFDGSYWRKRLWLGMTDSR